MQSFQKYFFLESCRKFSAHDVKKYIRLNLISIFMKSIKSHKFDYYDWNRNFIQIELKGILFFNQFQIDWQKLRFFV